MSGYCRELSDGKGNGSKPQTLFFTVFKDSKHIFCYCFYGLQICFFTISKGLFFFVFKDSKLVFVCYCF